MTDMREKLAKVVAKKRHSENCQDDGGLLLPAHGVGNSDAILSALPDMIETLVWEGLISGSYEITILDGGIAGVHYHGNRDEDGDPEYLRGGYMTLVSMEDLMECANTHHRKQVMKAFGVKL